MKDALDILVTGVCMGLAIAGMVVGAVVPLVLLRLALDWWESR